MPFDISTLSAADTIDIEIPDPRTGETLLGDDGKPCSVTVHSPGSRDFAAAKSEASNKAIKRLRQKGKSDTTPDEDIASTAAFLTRITVSFNNFTYKDGDGSSKDTFRACYLDTSVGFITEAVNLGAGDWGNSLRAAPSN